MMCHKVLDKREKSSNSVIFPESWFKHFTELFRKKNIFGNITLSPIYLPIETFQSVVYRVHRVITIQNHPGPN